MVFCLISPLWGDLSANMSSYERISEAETHSLNTVYVSQCSPETVQEIQFERTDLNS